MADQSTFERIVAALHSAALDPVHWAQATHLIDDACALLATHLSLYDTRTSPPSYLFSKAYGHGEDMTDIAREYTEDYYPRDERIPRIFRLPLNRFTANDNEAVYTEQERKTSITYNECLPRIGSNNQLGVRLGGSVGLESQWWVTKPAGRDWPATDVALLQALLPHIRHALDVHHALVRAEVSSPSLAGLLDTRQVGAIFFDQRGQILAVNDRAQAFLGNGLSDRGGVLRSRSRNATLGRLIAGAIHGRPPVGGSMRLERGNGSPPLILHVSPVTTPRSTFGACALPVLVLVSDPYAPPSIDASLLESLGLTPAESEIAAALAKGHTVRDIAVTTHRSYSTVRWLLKQIYAKTDLTRQADLVRLVLSLA